MAPKRLVLRFRGRRGFTLAETMIAVSLVTLLALGGLTLTVSAVQTWNVDIARGSMENDIATSMRMVTEELRPAVSVVVDPDGQGLTYWLPLQDDEGNIPLPLRSDGVGRRIFRSTGGDELRITGRSRPIARDLAPAAEGDRLFTFRASNRAIVIVLTCRFSTGQQTLTTTKTEVVSLRNYR